MNSQNAKTIPAAHVISRNPLIITGVWDLLCRMDLQEILPRNERVYIFCFLWWSREFPYMVDPIPKFLNTYKEICPYHQFIFLCNTKPEKQFLEKYNLEAIYCNHNAFLDESRYDIVPNIEKKYDALYNAKLVDWKRHHLAARIKNLALLAHTQFDPSDRDKVLGKRLRHKLLSGATWLNDNFGESERNIPPEELPQYINQAKVGLCLSAIEGAMYASMEYLLCGLPVVSTKSQGGRDVFFDKEYVKICLPNSFFVARGVKELIKRNIPPQYVRSKALEKIKPHRERFIERVQNIYDAEGAMKNFQSNWHSIFTDKLLNVVNF